MRALAIDRFCTPKDYNLATLPVPKISQPDEVLIKVHSAAVNPGELKLASGQAQLAPISSLIKALTVHQARKAYVQGQVCCFSVPSTEISVLLLFIHIHLSHSAN